MTFPPELYQFFTSWEAVASLKLFIAVFLASIIGFERSSKNKPVGIRTCIIITISSTLFTILSIGGFKPFMENGPHDPARLAAQVLSGIGFIGAGAIIYNKNKSVIVGITTAASIWALTAIGMAVGTGLYLLASITTVILAITLHAHKMNHYGRPATKKQSTNKKVKVKK